MAAIARLAAVSLDARDPSVLSRFYQDLLGLEVYFESPDFVALRGAPTLITIQRVTDLPPVSWPEGPIPKQIHLEFAVDDLEEAERAAIGVGARVADEQPSPDRWRVLLDPAGHPFCRTTLVPEV
jgi:catechol 2,3-dioxygenase-like lactoylglutathione lyase family enzyme